MNENERKFWCVVSRFFDNGKVKTSCFEVTAPTLPPHECNEGTLCDEYRDYFESYDEAKQYERDCWNA